MQEKYDYSQIPSGWQYCFNGECPKAGECLRYQAGCQLPDDIDWGPAVFRGALKSGKCRFFRKDEKVVLATGFVLENNPSQNEMFRSLRLRLTHYLGGNGTYYLYRNGKKWLTPKQQEDIRQMFRRAGYKEEVEFGETKEAYDFT